MIKFKEGDKICFYWGEERHTGKIVRLSGTHGNRYVVDCDDGRTFWCVHEKIIRRLAPKKRNLFTFEGEVEFKECKLGPYHTVIPRYKDADLWALAGKKGRMVFTEEK